MRTNREPRNGVLLHRPQLCACCQQPLNSMGCCVVCTAALLRGLPLTVQWLRDKHADARRRSWYWGYGIGFALGGFLGILVGLYAPEVLR